MRGILFFVSFVYICRGMLVHLGVLVLLGFCIFPVVFALLGVISTGSVVGLSGSVAHPCLGVVFPYGWVSLNLFGFWFSPVFRCIPFAGISVPFGSRLSAHVMHMFSELAPGIAFPLLGWLVPGV